MDPPNAEGDVPVPQNSQSGAVASGSGQESVQAKEDQKVAPTQKGDEFDDATVENERPAGIPDKNKGINPTSVQKHPSKTLKGETKPGAKQDRKNPYVSTAKVLSLGQSEPMTQGIEGT